MSRIRFKNSEKWLLLEKFLRSLKPSFRENLGLKVLSLLFALGLYAYVHGAQDAHRSINVDLVVLLPPAQNNRTLVTDLPSSVRVNIHGPRSLVAEMRPSDLGNLQLDLRGNRSGHVVLTPSMLSVPGGVIVDSIDPPYLDIVWDEVVERQVSVRVPLEGDPPDGYVVKGTPVVRPATVVAKGPKQIVDGLSFAKTEAFDVSRLKEGKHRRTLALERPPRRVEFRPTAVTVEVVIARKLQERLFSKVPVQLVAGPPDAKIIPPRVDIRVKGPADIVRPLRVEQIVPRVSLEGVDWKKTPKGAEAREVAVDIDKVEVSVIPRRVVVKW